MHHAPLEGTPQKFWPKTDEEQRSSDAPSSANEDWLR